MILEPMLGVWNIELDEAMGATFGFHDLDVYLKPIDFEEEIYRVTSSFPQTLQKVAAGQATKIL